MEDDTKKKRSLDEGEIVSAKVSRRTSLALIVGAAAVGVVMAPSRSSAQTTDRDPTDNAGEGSDSDTGPGSDPPGHGHRRRIEGCTDGDSGRWADVAGWGSRCH
jgi:hypothetical protein